jgi:hypothetical protein
METTTTVAGLPQEQTPKTGNSVLWECRDRVAEHTFPASTDNDPAVLPMTAPPEDLDEPQGLPLGSSEAGVASSPVDPLSQTLNPRIPSESVGETNLRASKLESMDNTLEDKYRASLPSQAEKRPTKDYTCYWWKSKGHCRFPDGVCYYAHRDTGLMAPAPGKVSGKLLTCFFWRKGHCQKRDEDCSFAHHDTGSYANEPGQWQKHVPDTSRKVSDQGLRYSAADHYSPISPRTRRDSIASGHTFEAHGSSSVSSNVDGWLAEVFSKNNEQASNVDATIPNRMGKRSEQRTYSEIDRDHRYGSDRVDLDVHYRQNCSPQGEDSRVTVPLPNGGLTTLTDESSQSNPPRIGKTDRMPQLSNSLLKSGASLNGNGASPEPSTEKVQPIRQFAKRSGIILDPRRRIAGAGSRTPPMRGLGSAGSEEPNLGVESLALTQANVDLATPGTSTKQSPDKINRLNRCHVCSKSIFGNSALCKGCESKSNDLRNKPVQSMSVAPEILDIFLDGDDIILSESRRTQSPADALFQDQKGISFASVEPMKGLKRAAPEDHMFIPSKKQKRKPAIPAVMGQSSSAPIPVSPIVPDVVPSFSPAKATIQMQPHAATLSELTELEQLRREVAAMKEASKAKPSEMEQIPTVAPETKMPESRADEPAQIDAGVDGRSKANDEIVQQTKTVEISTKDVEPTAKDGEARQHPSPKPKPSITVDKRLSPQDRTPSFRKPSSTTEEVPSPNRQGAITLRVACLDCNRRRVSGFDLEHSPTIC